MDIHVHRYGKHEAKNPETGEGYVGWIEPDDRSWVMFIRTDNVPEVFLFRNPHTGEVLNEPYEEPELANASQDG